MDHPHCEIANILGEEDWTSEPVMRPEDEIMLKKLHDMLQSTAEELRDLSSDILHGRQPAVQVRTRPTPLDEEYNEKVHVKEMVEAKFNGRLLIDKKDVPAKHILEKKQAPKVQIPKNKVNAGVQVDFSSIATGSLRNEKKPTPEKATQTNNSNSQAILGQSQKQPPHVLLAYDEHKSEEVKNIEVVTSQKYIIQEMPSIQIRSQLTEQRVVNLNILPTDNTNKPVMSSNSAVFEINRDVTAPSNTKKQGEAKPEQLVTRKVVKIPCCESSELTNKSNSESELMPLNDKKLIKLKQSRALSVRPQRRVISMHKSKANVNNNSNRESTVPHRVSDEWKKKLNVIYGKPSTSKTNRTLARNKSKISQNKAQSNCQAKRNEYVKQTNVLKTTEYVPYSKLTLGGVNVSEIENEIANISDKADLPLSPILDKILNSYDNSFQESPRTENSLKELGPFSKSDENLLKEVLDIDHKIKKTLNRNFVKIPKTVYTEDKNSMPNPDNDNDVDSYGDDFDEEVEKSDQSKDISPRIQSSSSNHTAGASEGNKKLCDIEENLSGDEYSCDSTNKKMYAINNKTYIKNSNLSLKNCVDIFEFVHSVDTQDNSTQSNKTQKISLKETQTSPRNKGNILPLNDTPQNQVSSNRLNFEKDFIKKLIMEEYGDVFEIRKNIAKSSTSRIEVADTESTEKNIASHPKDTQTSPSHVKNVMTSPLRSITNAHSAKRLTMQRQASPLIVSNLENSTPVTRESDLDDAGITVNLSSPRFNLRLPKTSRDVISNLDSTAPSSKISNSKTKLFYRQNKDTQTSMGRKVSSSESWNDETESDVSSLGEVNWRLQRERARARHATASESSSASVATSSLEACSEIFRPTKSEGEVSVGQL